MRETFLTHLFYLTNLSKEKNLTMTQLELYGVFNLSEHTCAPSPHSLFYNGAYESTMRIMKRTDSGYLKWLGMLLHGAASNLWRGGQTAWGGRAVAAGMFLKTHTSHTSSHARSLPPSSPRPNPPPFLRRRCCTPSAFRGKQLLSQRKRHTFF